MRIKTIHIHVVVAVLWLGVAMAIAISTALLGNEQIALARQRGADLKARNELSTQNDRYRVAIDSRTSPPVLTETVRRLGLGLKPAQDMAKK
jgi:hypothetical protein